MNIKVPSVFWRLGIASEDSFQEMIQTSTAVCPDADFLLKAARGHGICLASYDSGSCCGKVRAVGLVSGADPATRKLNTTWRLADLTLKPNPSGRRYWTDRPYFGFAKSVVERYMLSSIFAEYFPEAVVPPSADARSDIAISANSFSISGTGDRGGYVYVIKSPYGYKIGKTKNMKQRSQLFSVKLPFAIEVISFGWFEDYSAAESNYHRTYAQKRMEGEWFDLDERDLRNISAAMSA